jgi:hypothetical protein
VSLDNWQTDANGCSVRGRRIASLKSSREGFSSEKVAGGLGEENLPREGNASLSHSPLHRVQVSVQDRCGSPLPRGHSWRDTGQLISGPFNFGWQPACCDVQLPRKESPEVYTVASLTFGFSHLASSSLYSQPMLRNLSQSMVGPRCSWVGETPCTISLHRQCRMQATHTSRRLGWASRQTSVRRKSSS